MPYFLDSAVGTVLCLCFALLFATAAWHKLRALREFRAVLGAYDLLPSAAVIVAAIIVPALELAIAAALLIFALAASRPSALSFTVGMAAPAAGAALLALYAAAIAINLRRGRHDLDCGCGGFANRRKITSLMVWRNGVFAALLVFVAVTPWSSRAYSWIDAVTVLGGVAAGALLYVAFEGLAQLAQKPLFAGQRSGRPAS